MPFTVSVADVAVCVVHFLRNLYQHRCDIVVHDTVKVIGGEHLTEHGVGQDEAVARPGVVFVCDCIVDKIIQLGKVVMDAVGFCLLPLVPPAVPLGIEPPINVFG